MNITDHDREDWLVRQGVDRHYAKSVFTTKDPHFDNEATKKSIDEAIRKEKQPIKKVFVPLKVEKMSEKCRVCNKGEYEGPHHAQDKFGKPAIESGRLPMLGLHIFDPKPTRVRFQATL